MPQQEQGMPPQGYNGPPGQSIGSNVLESHGVNPQHGFINQSPAGNLQGPGIPQSQGQPQEFPLQDIRCSDHQPLPAPQVVQQNTVGLVAGQICLTCRMGVVRERINVCMIVMVVLFFPIGLLFLFCAKERVCDHCGATFG